MIDEILFMETRVFREFCKRYKMTPKKVNDMFNLNKIWEYIESCYDLLHTTGDEYVLEDIINILRNKGVAL